jgi:hypothetical protein
MCVVQFFGRIFWTNDLGKWWRFVLGSQTFDGLDQWAAKAARKSGKDDYDKFSLPVGSGFFEDALKLGARRLISDAQFDRSAPKCFSCHEMKC